MLPEAVATPDSARQLAALIAEGGVLVLTGAGVSTQSGLKLDGEAGRTLSEVRAHL